MEGNHCVIKDIRPRNQLIEKVPMTSSRLFPFRIVPENTRAAVKEESKEEVVYFDNKENHIVEIQAAFQTKVHDDFSLWHFSFGHLNFGGMKLLHTKNMVKGFPLIDKPERVCEGYIFGKQHRETFPV